MLFLVFVDDLPDWVVNGIHMFADDTKVWRKIARIKDRQSLLDDLNNPVAWSDKWLFKFKVEKCKVMHICHQIQTEYEMTDDRNAYKLWCSEEEKNIGVYIADNLKPRLQCAKVA